MALPAAAGAEPPAGEAGWMYDPGKVTVIDLTLSPQAIAELEDEPDEYVKGGFSLHETDGTPEGEEGLVGEALDEVGIRLKGKVLGSFRDLSEKAGFKLKFTEFDGPKFSGLKKMTLNNMVQDPSMLHETLAYRAFRGAGIAASRTGYAYLRVNGEDYGLYLNLENLDKVNLERWFGDFDDATQHLYEGEYGTDVTPGGAAAFEIDEGDGPPTDLEALIAAANSGLDDRWSDSVTAVADLSEMTRMWAVEKYIGHWDGYSGQHGELQPNNYYLYSDAAGRFQMLPWGTDQTWSERIAFDGPGGLLFDRCLRDPRCEALYRRELRSVGRAIATLGLDDLAGNTAELLRPWQEIEPEEKSEYDLGQLEDAIAATEAFVRDRPGELDAWLGPEEDGSRQGEEAEPIVPPPSLLPAVPARLRIGHPRARGAVLSTSLNLPGAGRVTQIVRLRTAHGTTRACTARAVVRRARAVDLRCRLSRRTRSRLRAHPLKLQVVIRFKPEVGPVETFSRTAFAPRLHGT